MISTIENTILSRNLFTPATPVVLMVSGGSDSTALAYIMKELSSHNFCGPLAILHVNHKIRGQEADDDQKFVEELAAKLAIPYFACEVNIPLIAAERGGNVEAIAREERYLAAHEALESLCNHCAVPVSLGRIVTAHTQDDRVENFYMRSIKGTGPGGFRSMLYKNGPVVRPLLDVSRLDLRNYLVELAQDEQAVIRDAHGKLWREDATNAHTDRFRAFVRHEIIPLAKSQNGKLLDTLTRTMNLIADEDDFMNKLAAQAYTEHLEWIGLESCGPGETPDGCLFLPSFGLVEKPLARRVVLAALKVFLGEEARIDSSSIEVVIDAFDSDGLPRSGLAVNIQGDLAVSANKKGVLLEPMAVFRARRKRK